MKSCRTYTDDETSPPVGVLGRARFAKTNGVILDHAVGMPAALDVGTRALAGQLGAHCSFASQAGRSSVESESKEAHTKTAVHGFARRYDLGINLSAMVMKWV